MGCARGAELAGPIGLWIRIGCRPTVKVCPGADTREAADMAKYMIKANYTLEGLKGVRAKGAKSRADAVGNMVNGMGGTVESFYFAVGDADVYVVADLPDDESAAAGAFTVSAAGGATTNTVKLLTIEQADAALGLSVDYVPPGG